MTITDNQARNLSALFTVLFAVSVVSTLWNMYHQHKLREIEKQLALLQLNKIKNGESV